MPGSRTRPPRWVRALLALDRTTARLATAERIVVEETVRAMTAPDVRDAVTHAQYEAQDTYRPGGRLHAQGLFDWEARALDDARFPRTGTVLLAGAGGGREMTALIERGYRVIAFEPSALALDAARSAGKIAGSSCTRASHGDLVEAVSHDRGPLAAVLRGQTIDAVLLGWTSFTHVLDPREHRAVFRALRTLAPAAPVIASWWEGDATSPARWQRALRDAMRTVTAHAPGGRSGEAPLDEHVSLSRDGFAYTFAPGEVDAVARACGYACHRLDGSVPHAVFTPV